jgi:glycosyltransferase involved in cell wall biosynthesis
MEIIIGANKLIEKRGPNCTVKIYGSCNSHYVDNILGGDVSFKRYYYASFPKSFKAISNILNKSKFVVDLSTIRYDGGGTQYTFLEAIHHGCALIINRAWIEELPENCCDFKEGYNCYAVSSAQELANIIKNAKNMDTERTMNNSKKLMIRHINAQWASA